MKIPDIPKGTPDDHEVIPDMLEEDPNNFQRIFHKSTS